MTNSHLEVAFKEDEAWLRMIGRATYASATDLRAFIEENLRREMHLVQIELGQCLSMDSTFIGILTKSAMGDGQDSLNVHLLNTPEHVVRQIRGLGLSRFFQFTKGALPDGEWHSITADNRNMTGYGDKLKKTMLEAHETLGRADTGNVPKFRNVIDALKKQSTTGNSAHLS